MVVLWSNHGILGSLKYHIITQNSLCPLWDQDESVACVDVNFQRSQPKRFIPSPAETPLHHAICSPMAGQAPGKLAAVAPSISCVNSSGTVDCQHQLIEVVDVTGCCWSWAASLTSKMLRCTSVFVLVVAHLCLASKHRSYSPGRYCRYLCNINVRKSFSVRIHARYNKPCSKITTSDGQELPWVDEIRCLWVWMFGCYVLVRVSDLRSKGPGFDPRVVPKNK